MLGGREGGTLGGREGGRKGGRDCGIKDVWICTEYIPADGLARYVHTLCVECSANFSLGQNSLNLETSTKVLRGLRVVFCWVVFCPLK